MTDALGSAPPKIPDIDPPEPKAGKGPETPGGGSTGGGDDSGISVDL